MRGRAFAATSRLREAAAELDSLRAVQRSASRLPPAVVVGFTSPAGLLDIATDLLAGDVAARAGRTAEAVRVLESAVRKEDALTYNEPADWYPPTRLTLGRVLVNAGRSREAQAVYREELRRRPNGRMAERGLARAEGRQTD